MSEGATASKPSESFTAALLHRWLVEYNPLYLVSAALVLFGVIVLSRGLAGSGSVATQMGITAIAELYAWALVGSAALLVRIGMRRPAVMLALLAALYQCDLTLHTATCAYLGTAGLVGSVLWAVSFVAKLRVLAWAMRLRLSRGAMVVPSIAAVGLMALPWLLPTLPAATGSAATSLWLFALFASGLWSRRRISSRVALGAWASTVARRCVRATWLGWSAMLMLHVTFWATHSAAAVRPGILFATIALLATRFVRRELHVWMIVGATLLWTGAQRPGDLWVSACMAGCVLALRALRFPTVATPAGESEAPHDPYRTVLPPSVPLMPETTFVRAPLPERTRLLVGAVTCLYLAGWSRGWVGGAWPDHELWLDLLLVVPGGLLAWRHRIGAAAVPGLFTVLHFVITARLLPAPQSTLQWGATFVVAGFALLGLSLGATVHFVRRRAQNVEP